MVRLYLFAEGQTEQTFAEVVLKPHLSHHRVFLHNPLLIAKAGKGINVRRGGGNRYLPMKQDIRRLLAQEKGRDVYFTTMIDLYGIHRDFPGLAQESGANPVDRVRSLEAAFAEDIGDQRFIPYLQLHEFEAYLFSDPAGFRLFYDGHERQIAALRKVAEDFGSPERIDDGLETAPSKRIIAQFPDYAGAKPSVGPQVAERIGLERIRSKCHHFHDWLSRLEGLDESK